VRKQALLVIMHLILNGMLKLKGEIVDILMLLLDNDEEIVNQVKLFLSELNIKDQNLIYNLFQNAINRLSTEFKL
jgi:condensin complex subunit 1